MKTFIFKKFKGKIKKKYRTLRKIHKGFENLEDFCFILAFYMALMYKIVRLVSINYTIQADNLDALIGM